MGGVRTVKRLKQGPRKLLQVELEGVEGPIFPPRCACCGDPSERGAFLVVRCSPPAKQRATLLRFPACQVCARHVPFFERLTDLMGWVILGLTVVTMGFGLVGYAAYASGQSGWEVVRAGLSLPFRGPILGMICLLTAGAVGVGYAVLSGTLLIPLYWVLAKRRCQETPVKGEILATSPPALRLTFENIAYADEFVKANGGEATRLTEALDRAALATVLESTAASSPSEVVNHIVDEITSHLGGAA